MTHAELVALLTEQAETLQYFCDSRDGVSPATAGEIATRLRTAADALAGETDMGVRLMVETIRAKMIDVPSEAKVRALFYATPRTEKYRHGTRGREGYTTLTTTVTICTADDLRVLLDAVNTDAARAAGEG